MFIEIRVNHVLGQEPNFLLSCQFFFSSCLISTKIWFDGLKGLKQHTVISQFSSSRQNFYQTLRRHGSRSTPKELSSSSWFLLASPFYYFLSPPLSYAQCKMQNRACTHHSQWKWMQTGIRSKPVGNCKLCNSRLCCLCLPIIQSFVRRVCVCVCRVFVNP